MSALELAGQHALAEAVRLWNLDVYDPPRSDTSKRADECRHIIGEIIASAGWGWATPYRGPEPQWCGLFAAHCWRTAGLDPKWLATYWASTYRLNLWASYQKFDQKHPNPRTIDSTGRVLVKLERGRPLDFVAAPGEARSIEFTPLPGDVLIVGDGDPHVGDHVTLVVSYDPARRVFDTISGNGGGIGPRGNRREGISRRGYAIDSGGYRAMWLIRPAFGDLLAEGVALRAVRDVGASRSAP